jgi:hypothetical protein
MLLLGGAMTAAPPLRAQQTQQMASLTSAGDRFDEAKGMAAS